jgi:hypothetical protein
MASAQNNNALHASPRSRFASLFQGILRSPPSFITEAYFYFYSL